MQKSSYTYYVEQPRVHYDNPGEIPTGFEDPHAWLRANPANEIDHHIRHLLVPFEALQAPYALDAIKYLQWHGIRIAVYGHRLYGLDMLKKMNIQAIDMQSVMPYIKQIHPQMIIAPSAPPGMQSFLPGTWQKMARQVLGYAHAKSYLARYQHASQ